MAESAQGTPADAAQGGTGQGGTGTEPGAKKNTWVWWAVAAFALIAAVLGYFLLTSGEAVTVPEVVGMSEDEATTTLEEAGLAVGSVTTTPSADVPVGVVVEQDPAADAEATEGDAVDLTVAGEEGAVAPAIPNVVGETEADAISAIEAVGFTARSFYEWSTDVPQGVVGEQLPDPGTVAEPGTSVGISVSKGPEPVEPAAPETPEQPAGETVDVPDVTGQAGDSAVSTLNGAGLLAQTFDMYDDSVAEGSVVSQYPEAGTKVLKGSSVAIVVSLGEEPSSDPDVVEIPDVVGMLADEAEPALGSAGLGVIPLEFPDDAAPEGQVIGQIPEAGAHVSADSYVAIVVSSGPAAATAGGE